MRIFCIFLFFSVIECVATMKVAYIADASLQQSNSAIFNGMKSVAKELSASHRKKIEIEFISSNSSEEQVQILSKCYIGGFSAAVVYSIDDSQKLSDKISELSEVGFLTVILGDNLDTKNAICRISTNAEQRRLFVEEIIKTRSKKNTKIACYLKRGTKSKSLSLEYDRAEIALKVKDFCSIDEFESLFKHRLLEIQCFDFYSEFAQKNAIEILRRDSYGEVFFAPELLSNMHPIARDTDREFVLCIGALPMLEYYLASGQITDCIYDDFYGWGIYALRAIVEKKFTSHEIKSLRLLPPMKASKEKYSIFVSDWQKWLK